jgi:hypothetical protein
MLNTCDPYVTFLEGMGAQFRVITTKLPPLNCSNYSMERHVSFRDGKEIMTIQLVGAVWESVCGNLKPMSLHFQKIIKFSEPR